MTISKVAISSVTERRQQEADAFMWLSLTSGVDFSSRSRYVVQTIFDEILKPNSDWRRLYKVQVLDSWERVAVLPLELFLSDKDTHIPAKDVVPQAHKVVLHRSSLNRVQDSRDVQCFSTDMALVLEELSWAWIRWSQLLPTGWRIESTDIPMPSCVSDLFTLITEACGKGLGNEIAVLLKKCIAYILGQSHGNDQYCYHSVSLVARKKPHKLKTDPEPAAVKQVANKAAEIQDGNSLMTERFIPDYPKAFKSLFFLYPFRVLSLLSISLRVSRRVSQVGSESVTKEEAWNHILMRYVLQNRTTHPNT